MSVNPSASASFSISPTSGLSPCLTSQPSGMPSPSESGFSEEVPAILSATELKPSESASTAESSRRGFQLFSISHRSESVSPSVSLDTGLVRFWNSSMLSNPSSSGSARVPSTPPCSISHQSAMPSPSESSIAMPVEWYFPRSIISTSRLSK